MSPDEREFVRLPFVKRFWTSLLRRDEQGIVLIVVLVVMMLLLGMGLTSLFSGYTNLLTSTNLKFATQARNMAEAGVNEAIYRLSRQEGQPGSIVPDLTNPNWKVEITFSSSNDLDASDGVVSSIQADLPAEDEHPAHPVTICFKKPDTPGNEHLPCHHPNTEHDVLFIDNSTTPPTFSTVTLGATPPNPIPANAYPVMQIVATGLDARGAERQILAEVRETTSFAPPAPLASGVDVNLNGSGFIDGVNHDHRIYISAGSGTDAIYGDGDGETTNSNNPIKDSPDDNVGTTGTTFFNVTVQAYPVTVQAYPAGGGSGGSCESGVGNPSLNVPLSQVSATNPQTPAYRACARQFDKRIAENPPPAGFLYDPDLPAWVGLTWISDPTHPPAGQPNCTIAPYNHSANPHWHGTNTGYASAIALSSTPVLLQDKKPTSTGVWNRGVFTWRNNNMGTLGASDPGFPGSSDPIYTTPPANTVTGTDCQSTALVCRPSTITTFPTFQLYLGLDDITFQNLLDKPDRCGGDNLPSCTNPISSSRAPQGFTYIKMSSLSDEFAISNIQSPSTNDFVLLYVDGSLRIASNFTFKGLIFVNGSLHVSGEPTILGAIMVRGSTNITAGTGNMTLLYSREAAKRSIQAAHPWSILTWEDTAIQGSTYTQ